MPVPLALALGNSLGDALLKDQNYLNSDSDMESVGETDRAMSEEL